MSERVHEMSVVIFYLYTNIKALHIEPVSLLHIEPVSLTEIMRHNSCHSSIVLLIKFLDSL